MKPYILVIDDEPDIRRLVSEILEDEGYAVSVAKDGASARDAVSLRTPSLILLDIWMPDVDGISLLKEFIEKFHLHCPVIMMSGHGTVEAAVEATRLGAYDFIEKPLSLSKLLMTVEKALSQGQGAVKPASFELSVIEAVELVGKSPAVEKLIKELASCAQHDVNVLLNGEAGSGRTYSAKYIHSRSKRNQGPFIELHSATLNGAGKHALELLLGKQLSNGIRPGLLEQGNGGSLYINDVAELNDALQTALYGALTSPAIYRVNGEEPLAVDVRVIAATRYDLEQEVRAGRFREDLYHCLNAYPVQVLPLRQHSEDVTDLIQHYVRLFSDKEGLPYRNFSLASQNRLRNHRWPGNILELENLVYRLLIKEGEPTIELEEVEAELHRELPADAPLATAVLQPEFELPLRQAREQFEKAYLQYHLQQTHGSVGKVAKLAGMERTHLYRKLRSLGIDTKPATSAPKEA